VCVAPRAVTASSRAPRPATTATQSAATAATAAAKPGDGFIAPRPASRVRSQPCGNGLQTRHRGVRRRQRQRRRRLLRLLPARAGILLPRQEGAACVPTVCGDSLIQGLEQCDDGNGNRQRRLLGDLPTRNRVRVQPTWHPLLRLALRRRHQRGPGTVRRRQPDRRRRLRPLCRPEPIYSCENGVCAPVCGDGITLYPFEPATTATSPAATAAPAPAPASKATSAPTTPTPPPQHPSRHRLPRLQGCCSRPGGHPHFQNGGCGGLSRAWSKHHLTADGKPVSSGHASTTARRRFNDWYRDTRPATTSPSSETL
jgi:hypothetical protein